MKILMAASCSSDPNLGVPGVMHSLANEYRNLGHEVRFLFRETPGRVGEMLFGMRLASSTDVAWADLVDSHAVEAWPLCAKRVRPVVVARSHGLELVVHRRLRAAARRGEAKISPIYWTYRGSLRLWSERWAIRHSDASFLLNRSDHDLCISEFSASPARLHLLPNGFPSVFAEGRLEVGPGNDGVAFVGSWLARKGNDTAVSVVERLLAHRPGTRILFAGVGVPVEVVREAFPASVRDRIEILSRFRREELPAILAGYGILLFPSRSEGYPLSLVESMACGVAPVGSRIPGVEDVILDGENGFLVPAEEPSAFAARILELLEDPERLASVRTRARSSVRHTSWDLLAKRQMGIYEALVRSRASGEEAVLAAENA